MNPDMFDQYYNYKIKTVYQYSILLTNILGIDKNKLWKRKHNIELSLDWIIKDYFSRITTSKNEIKFLIKSFLPNLNTNKYDIDKELFSVIQYFISNGKIFEINNYEREIVLMASIIYISNELDISTSPYKINSVNYKTLVVNLIEKFNKIPYFNLIDNGKKNISILIELVKTNVRKERKIFEYLTNSSSLNRYVGISEDNNYYLSQFNYNVSNLDKYDRAATKFVLENNGIEDDFTFISADLIIVTLMKLLSVRQNYKYFFLPLKTSFLMKENNIKKLSLIFKNSILKKYILLLLNYDDFDLDKLSIFFRIKSNFYIYCSKNTNITDGNRLKGCFNYLVSHDFYENNKSVIEKWQNENINVIVEHFDGIVTDRNIVEIR